MNLPLPIVRKTLAIAAACWLAFVLPGRAEEYDDIGTVKSPGAAKWGGLLWKTAELNAFKGRPATTNDQDTTHFITVAYNRYVSFYDLKGHAPRWVAYVTTRASAKVAAAKSRTGLQFTRPGAFFVDGVVATASKALLVAPVEHDDFTDTVPEGLAAADLIPKDITAKMASAYPAYIERGHLAPNNTMKCWGTSDQGQRAQYESFSLANVVPQMSGHNAPTWSALEEQCLHWAKQLGTVCVVVGPIYQHPASPRHIESRKTSVRGELPFPDALFCVVIGKRGTKLSAVGFIMPQQTAKYGYGTKAVAIDEIEAATGIDFMPRLGEPNQLEEAVGAAWLNN